MPPIILRIILIVFRNPAVCLCNAVLCRKKLKEGFYWGGVCLHCFYSCRHYSGTQLLYLDFRCFSGPAQMILSAFLVLFLFKISEYVSVLSRKIRNLPCRFPF